MTEATHYDAIILGSGQGGNPLAVALAAKGKRTAMVERAAVGGTCVNYGCTPTKTMVASAEIAYSARRAAEYGVRVGDVSVDMLAVRERKRSVVKTWREGSERRLKQAELVDLTLWRRLVPRPQAIASAVECRWGAHADRRSDRDRHWAQSERTAARRT